MEAQTVPPCETHAPVSSALKDPHDAISHTETRSHGGLSIVQNSTKPKLRAFIMPLGAVTPCETLLLLALCSRAEALRR